MNKNNNLLENQLADIFQLHQIGMQFFINFGPIDKIANIRHSYLTFSIHIGLT